MASYGSDYHKLGALNADSNPNPNPNPIPNPNPNPNPNANPDPNTSYGSDYHNLGALNALEVLALNNAAAREQLVAQGSEKMLEPGP